MKETVTVTAHDQARLQVLNRLLALGDTLACGARGRERIRQTHAELAARSEHLHYQAFVQAGYPIGSGCVESANKLLVETRLKGSGVHWARDHVNPMLSLRMLVCNQRWEDTWPTLWQHWREQTRIRTRQRRQARHAEQPAPAPPAPAPTPPVTDTNLRTLRS